MTDSMNVKKNILLYAWQLPQNLLGALMFWWYRRNSKIFKGTFRDIRVLYSDRMRGGLSLGEYVILPFSAGWLPECSWLKDVDNLHRHEWGHSWQSRLLGWLYLPFVGFQSLAHASLHGPYCGDKEYHHFWTERWADRLGGVERD